jgi:hypothetical protein
MLKHSIIFLQLIARMFYPCVKMYLSSIYIDTNFGPIGLHDGRQVAARWLAAILEDKVIFTPDLMAGLSRK